MNNCKSDEDERIVSVKVICAGWIAMKKRQYCIVNEVKLLCDSRSKKHTLDWFAELCT